MLPLSHDEVVHGKGSLIGKMPGDVWQQFANLRLLYGYMWAHPGKKLLFMGGEFGQRREWTHERELDWDLLQHREHAGVQRWVADLNALYRGEPALHELDFEPPGFEWVDATMRTRACSPSCARPRRARRCWSSATSRRCRAPNYRVGVPRAGTLARTAQQRRRDLRRQRRRQPRRRRRRRRSPAHGRFHSLTLTLPPLAALFLQAGLDG